MNPPSMVDLQEHPVLGTLSEQSLERLLQVCRTEHVRRNRALYTSGERAERVWLVVEGSMKVTSPALNQREVILDLLGPGDLAGEDAVVTDIRLNSASGLRDTSLMGFPSAAIRTLWFQDSDFAVAWVRYFAESRQRLQDRMTAIAYGNIEDRLFRVLLQLAQRHGERTEFGASALNFPLTHQELANLIGATRETTTLAVGRLVGLGAIEFQDRRIVLIERGGEGYNLPVLQDEKAI